MSSFANVERRVNRISLHAVTRVMTHLDVVVAMLMVSCSDPQSRGCAADVSAQGKRILIFSRTVGYRHASIPDGINAIDSIGKQHGIAVEHTEDAAAFSPHNLSRFSAVVFLNTTGDVLDSTQQSAFEGYVRSGGGFVGVHSATDTEYGWEWYGKLVGAYFRSHPSIQAATVHITEPTHVSTQCLPSSWTRTDEWYDFRALPSDGISILATVDEATYSGGAMGSPHPIAWYHEFEGGRAWYTAMGHTSESYAESAFLHHLAGGIVWAVGQ